jgi:CheY-like chemotaxis protein
MEPACGAKNASIATTDFLYIRFIGDRSIDEKDFGKIQKDRVVEMKKWSNKLKGYYYYQYNERRRFEVYTYNNPTIAISEFKPNFYDLLVTDIFMPTMNGLELYQKIVEIDPNIRVCFMSSAEINIEALMEVYPKLSFGCFIKKPVEIEYLAKRLKAELD